MKIKKLIPGILLMVALAFAIAVSGCRKDKNEDEDNDTQVAKDNALAEIVFNDVMKYVDDGMRTLDDSLSSSKGAKGGASTLAGGCVTLTITPFDTITWPKTITLDFGTTNCLCIDGKYRRGKIVIVTTGRYKTTGTIITTTLQDYYVNDYKVQGTKVVENKGTNTQGNLYYTITVTNASVTTPNGTITWNSNRTREWIEGSTTPWPFIFDDVYKITGSASGTSINGNSYTVNIIKSLRVEIVCWWIVSGTLEFTIQGKPVRTLDYGNGTCDNDATVTINGTSYPIKLNWW